MNKYIRKTAAAFCAAVMTAALALPMPLSTQVTAVTDSDPDLILHYDTPAGTNMTGNAWDNAESFYKALPIGNGRIGAGPTHIS